MKQDSHKNERVAKTNYTVIIEKWQIMTHISVDYID